MANISSKFSSNSEANASELLENSEEMYCMEAVTIILSVETVNFVYKFLLANKE